MFPMSKFGWLILDCDFCVARGAKDGGGVEMLIVWRVKVSKGKIIEVLK